MERKKSKAKKTEEKVIIIGMPLGLKRTFRRRIVLIGF
jgi:hypothetical protein